MPPPWSPTGRSTRRRSVSSSRVRSLAHSVYGYFLNGGGAAYVVRIGANDTSPQSTGARAELSSGDGKGALTAKAIDPGAAGNDIAIEFADASEPGDETFKLLVKRQGQVVETFDNVSLKRGPNNVVTKVKAESKLITLEETKGGSARAAGARS